MTKPLQSGANLDEGNHSGVDLAEVQKWQHALERLLQEKEAQEGAQLVRTILDALVAEARLHGIHWRANEANPYLHNMALGRQKPYPGNSRLEQRLAALIRWNASAMVVRANARCGALEGQLENYAAVVDLLEVGFHHFFHAAKGPRGGDLIYFPPHSAPGIYARAFLEGRLPESAPAYYRQDIAAQAQGEQGLCATPDPWLMPDFWQFPVGTMGTGPLGAIYQASFMRDLEHRNLRPAQERRVWGFFDADEMDEPQTIAALNWAARQELDNCTFVICCHLSHFDDFPQGEEQTLEALESLFTEAGWSVVKCLWESHAEAVLAQDHIDAHTEPLLAGKYHGAEIYAAFECATQTKTRPSVVLVKTVKGHGNEGIASTEPDWAVSATHQKLQQQDLLNLRDRFDLPLSDAQVKHACFYKPADDSPEMQYLHERRKALGGYWPQRHVKAEPLDVPALEAIADFAIQANGQVMSTAMAFARQLGNCFKDAHIGQRMVPIRAHSARTLGMDKLFKCFGIDAPSMPFQSTSCSAQVKGQRLLEAAAISLWTAAATSYSVHGFAMLPFYIHASMFGFHRVENLIGAAAAQRARGFLIGISEGRTNLGPESSPQQGGSSHLSASTFANCRAYTPAFAGEMAVIMEYGMRAMLQKQEDVFYSITVHHKSIAQPNVPQELHAGVIKGMYCFQKGDETAASQVQLLGSGAMMEAVIKAAFVLQSSYGISATVWSVTSFMELARDSRAQEKALQTSESTQGNGWFAQHMLDTQGPIVAVTGETRTLAEMLRAYVPAGRSYVTLGADDFDSGGCCSNLHYTSEAESSTIVQAVLRSLMQEALEHRKEKLSTDMSAWLALAVN